VLLTGIFLVLAFTGLWFGSGLIVDAIKKLARKIRIPSFAFSFFILGLLTSIPEIAVGINAISENRPEIFVGTLLGGVIVMFLLVIPLLAVLSKAVHIKKHLSDKSLLVTLGIIATPALFATDQVITNLEGFVLVALYVTLFYIIKTRKGMLGRVENVFKHEHLDWRHSSFLHLCIGIIVVFISSRYIVDQTIELSTYFGVSTFIASLLVLSVGTNLPEIALAIRSLTSKAEDVALGDYLGSAAANTLLFGIFTLINNGEVVTEKQFFITFIIIIVALGTFYAMTRGKSKLTRKEGFALLGFYAAFICYEALTAL
jgi:cation:H+ antiporter